MFTTANAFAAIPNVTLWSATREPCYAVITELCKQCHQNAAAVSSSSGGGNIDGKSMPCTSHSLGWPTWSWLQHNLPPFASKNKHHKAKCQHLKARKNFHQMTIIKIAHKNLHYPANKPTYWCQHQGQCPWPVTLSCPGNLPLAHPHEWPYLPSRNCQQSNMPFAMLHCRQAISNLYMRHFFKAFYWQITIL